MILVTRRLTIIITRSYLLNHATQSVLLWKKKIEIEELIKHGTMLPHNMMGLTDEQVEELKLKDEWGEKCVPMGGWTFNKDVIGM